LERIEVDELLLDPFLTSCCRRGGPTFSSSTENVDRLLRSTISSSLIVIGAARLPCGMSAADPLAPAGATPASSSDATPAALNASVRFLRSFRFAGRFDLRTGPPIRF
jgi:hypothetical protein